MKILTYTNDGKNSFLCETQGGWILINTGYKQDLNAFRRFLRRNGLKASDLQAVILTDCRAASAGFAAELLNMTKADLYVSGQGAPGLLQGRNISTPMFTASRGAVASLSRMIRREETSNCYAPVSFFHRSRLKYTEDLNVRSELLRQFGVRVLASPGYTPDSVTYYFDSGETFCGNAVRQGFGVMHHLPRMFADREELVRTWQSLISVNNGMLYPSEGRPFSAASLHRDLNDLKKAQLYAVG